MFFSRDVRLSVIPERYGNDAYDIVNLFYTGEILRDTRGVGEEGADIGDIGTWEADTGGVDPEGAGTGDADTSGADLICITVTEDNFQIKTSFTDTYAGVFGAGAKRPYAVKMALYAMLKTRAALEQGGISKRGGDTSGYGAEAMLLCEELLSCGELLPWGALTGIRPIKLYADLADDGFSNEEIVNRMLATYDVTPDISKLCIQIASRQRDIIRGYSNSADYMLYIGIPFCVSKCAYCSFPSDAHNKAAAYEVDYIGALTKELHYIAGVMRGAGRRARAVYIGGGTPTALGLREFERFIYFVAELFGDDRPDEITVEAGRADTIDAEKLSAVKVLAPAADKLRLCINPQTMNPGTLELIGRRHTPGDVIRAFRLARDAGFDNINSDIIAGLPGESVGDFENTLEAVAGLAPDSLTAHTLSIKRSSKLNEFTGRYSLPPARETAVMLEAAFRFASGRGMRPYYLYRQKNKIGNLANVGFAADGAECAYNIHEMADKIDVLAAGAGAVSKFTDGNTGRIERVFNVKNLLEYISRIDEMIKRKQTFFLHG